MAIYGKPLTADQVLAHYNTGVSGAPTPVLNVALINGNVTLTWTSGTLQESDTLGGSYRELPEARSPYSPATVSSVKFYRLLP